jgi:cellulose synthase/poly-beta-1,6-N-acetylglucosamine synthase-like glycosyltransferase
MLRFVIVVPAHDEALGISNTLSNLKEIDYPDNLYNVVVIVDNCTDNTKAVVEATGIQYIERKDPSRKGKGYALGYAFSKLIKENYDAFVIVDADSLLNKEFLKIMNNRLLSGQNVIQSYDGLSNPDSSALTYLFFIGNTIENKLFYEAKSRLGLSANLRGNGMCFSRDILLQFPWDAFSITEDTEYSLTLIQNGIKINFASEARVFAKQPENLQQAHNQRIRWASGNFKISKSYILKLILRGLIKRNIILLDTALSFFILSKPLLLLLNFLLIGCSFCFLSANTESGKLYLGWSLSLLFIQIIYFAIGILMERISLRKIKYILFSPFFAIWFFVVTILGLIGYRSAHWQRTNRIG